MKKKYLHLYTAIWSAPGRFLFHWVLCTLSLVSAACNAQLATNPLARMAASNSQGPGYSKEFLERALGVKLEGTKLPEPTAEMTEQQKTLMVESPDLFSYVEVKVPNWGSSAFWMDDRHIIASFQEIGTWKQQITLNESPRIGILDTVTQEIKETQYVGYLKCYSPNQIVVKRDQTKWTEYWVGKLGEELRLVTRNHFEEKFSPFTCEPYNEKSDPRALEVGASEILPLRNEDGYLVFTKGEFAPGARILPGTEDEFAPGSIVRPAQVSLYDPFGRLLFKHDLQGKLYWEEPTLIEGLDRYFVRGLGRCGNGFKGDGKISGPLTFGPRTGFAKHAVPPLFLNMIDWCWPSGWDQVDTAQGIVYAPKYVYGSRHKPAYNRGLYIQRGDKTHRFMKAHGEIVGVSPSGCKLMFSYAPEGFLNSTRDTKRTRIFNLCSGVEK
ncbi:MAG: hypothetical protein H7293_06365 [Candidatus Saccharibacteria bacterium]|nr:hypothetical protein [Rhodoferax sp.]